MLFEAVSQLTGLTRLHLDRNRQLCCNKADLLRFTQLTCLKELDMYSDKTDITYADYEAFTVLMPHLQFGCSITDRAHAVSLLSRMRVVWFE